jgi:hypothetical protein
MSSTSFEVRALVPDDVSDLASCVVDCYGDSYPKRDLYDVARLSQLVRDGSYCGVVVIDSANSSLIGHVGWTRHAPNAPTVEAGATMVRPLYRGQGLLKLLGTGLHNLLRQSGFAGYVHFPTTAHTVMQRASVSSGGAETGLLLGYLPAALDIAGFAGPRERRLAVTVAYQPLGDAPVGAIGAASVAEAVWLAEVAGKLGLRRTITVKSDEPSAALTRLTSSYVESRDLLSILVTEIGRDLPAVVDRAVAGQPCLLVHVDVDASDVAASWALRELRSIGFVFGAWLPGWLGSDVIRLQRISDSASVDLSPELFTDEARALLDRTTS